MKTVKEAIAEFYQLNDFGEDGGVSKSFVWIKILFFSIPIPNTSSRQKNVLLHDINHLITGNDTTWKGEVGVSAFEIASGGWRSHFMPWLLTLWAMGLGVVLYPSAVIAFFKKGLTMNNALTCDISREEQLSLTILELQNRVSNLPVRKINLYFWMVVSLGIFVMPFLFGLGAICLGFYLF